MNALKQIGRVVLHPLIARRALAYRIQANRYAAEQVSALDPYLERNRNIAAMEYLSTRLAMLEIAGRAGEGERC